MTIPISALPVKLDDQNYLVLKSAVEKIAREAQATNEPQNIGNVPTQVSGEGTELKFYPDQVTNRIYTFIRGTRYFIGLTAG